MISRGPRVLAAVAAFALLPVGAPAGAQSGDTVESGVWWQLNQGGPALPPPPVLVDIPDGGLWLNSGPNGDTARSAVRFTVPERAVPEEVVLRIHQDSSTPEPAVALCAPENEWQPPEERPGPWEERAVPDCDRFSTIGTIDGEVIRFALDGPDVGDDVDLVLTRVPDDTESYINVTFQQPTASDVRTGSPVSSGGFVAPPTTTASPTVGGTGSGFDGGTGSGFDAGASSIGGGSFDGGDSMVDIPSVDADLSPVEEEPTGLDEAPPTTEIAAAPAAFDDPWDAARWVALVALVLISAWIAAILSNRLRGGGPSAAGFTIYRGTPPA